MLITNQELNVLLLKAVKAGWACSSEGCNNEYYTGTDALLEEMHNDTVKEVLEDFLKENEK